MAAAVRLMPATVASDRDISWKVLCGGSFLLNLHVSHRWPSTASSVTAFR